MKHRLWICMLTSVLVIRASGQEKSYYYGVNTRPVNTEEEAIFLKRVDRNSENKYVIRSFQKEKDDWKFLKKERIRVQGDGIMVIYQNSSSILPRKIYREMEEIRPGFYQFREFDLTHTLRTGTSTTYLPLTLDGKVKEYHPFGELKSESVYENNQLVSNENWLPDGTRYIDSIFYSVDKEPEYQMGDGFFKDYLLTNLNQSGIDLTQIEDEVVLGWVIMETGELDGAMAFKGKSKQLNDFLVKTVEELPGYWTPARLDGKPVRYFMTIPLNFLQRNANFQEVEFSGNVMHYDRY